MDISHEKLDKPFQYRIPEELEGKLLPGMVVEIPFGRGDRLIKGYVIGTTDRAEIAPERIKSIMPSPPTAWAWSPGLSLWRPGYGIHYGATMIQALKTVIPVRKKGKTKREKAGTAGGI